MCKSNITVKKFLKLILQIEFYRIIICLIFAFFGYEEFSVWSFVKVLIPVKEINDNFTSSFLVFFLFIPFLNILLKHLSERMHLRFIFLCLFLYTFLSTLSYLDFGVTMNYVSWFIVIYFISSYLRLYPKKLFGNTKVWDITSAVSIVVSVLSILVPLRFIWHEPYYFIADSNKVLAVITAFCLFLFFKNVKIPYIKFINVVASATFGVLLIHANSDAMRQWIWKDTLQNTVVFNTSWCYVHFVYSVLGIYIICTVIDLIRIYTLEKPFFKRYDKVSDKFYSKFYKLENKLTSKFNIR